MKFNSLNQLLYRKGPLRAQFVADPCFAYVRLLVKDQLIYKSNRVEVFNMLFAVFSDIYYLYKNPHMLSKFPAKFGYRAT